MLGMDWQELFKLDKDRGGPLPSICPIAGSSEKWYYREAVLDYLRGGHAAAEGSRPLLSPGSDLVQEFTDWAGEVDGSVIRGVLLCGNRSKNGYEIPPSAFGGESGVKWLYEGKLVFMDHNSDKPLDRSTRDLAGVVRDVALKFGKPRANIDTEGYPAGEALLALAKRRPRGVGLSHVAGYRRSRDKKTVEAITEVFSVDVVIRPATTDSFFESEAPGEFDAKQVLERDDLFVAPKG
jgi:hypothetical protein